MLVTYTPSLQTEFLNHSTRKLLISTNYSLITRKDRLKVEERQEAGREVLQVVTQLYIDLSYILGY